MSILIFNFIFTHRAPRRARRNGKEEEQEEEEEQSEADHERAAATQAQQSSDHSPSAGWSQQGVRSQRVRPILCCHWLVSDGFCVHKLLICLYLNNILCLAIFLQYSYCFFFVIAW